MKQIIHVVGEQGSGKTEMAWIISKDYERRGKTCSGVDSPMSEFIKDREQAIAQWPEADVIFIEHLPGETFKTAPGDRIITLERIPQ